MIFQGIIALDESRRGDVVLVSYDTNFFDYNETALASARAVVPIVSGMLPPPASVADFGCARGIWLSVWRSAGAEVVGVDGDYVDTSRLMIPRHDFRAADLSAPIDLARRFDLVQSLEEAEHPRQRSQAGRMLSNFRRDSRAL